MPRVWLLQVSCNSRETNPVLNNARYKLTSRQPMASTQSRKEKLSIFAALRKTSNGTVHKHMKGDLI